MRESPGRPVDVAIAVLMATAAASCVPPEATPPRSTLHRRPVASQATPAATVEPPAAPGAVVGAEPPPAASAQPVEESLASRREKVVASVREEVGGNVSCEVISDYYILMGSKVAVAQSADFVRRVLEAYFHGRFDKGVSQPLPILLFPDAATYHGYCQKTSHAPCISRFGFFEPSGYRLVMNLGPGIGTLSHELVHPILEADFPGTPTWLNEGIASLFEAPVIPRAGEIHGAKNWRLPRLLQALRTPAEREHATIAHLMATSLAEFRDDKEDLHYAAARYLCQWLDGRGLLWSFYHRYRDNVATDPRGEASFEAVVGESAKAAEAKWERWVRAL